RRRRRTSAAAAVPWPDDRRCLSQKRTFVLDPPRPAALPSALGTDLRGEPMTTTEPGLRGFMSPFEVPARAVWGGGGAMYRYSALFSGGRRASGGAGGWFGDGMPSPEPMFPFDFVTADSPYMCLGQANSRIFAVPPALGIDHRVLYGWVYMSPNGVADEAEIGRRAGEFQKRAGYYFQNWDELYAKWRAKVEEEIRGIESLEVPDLPDDEDEAVVMEGRGIGSGPTLLVGHNRRLRSVAPLLH